jgi:hypothetical protein
MYCSLVVRWYLCGRLGNSKDPQGDSASFWTTLAPRLSLLDTATVDLALYLSGCLRVSNHRGKCKAWFWVDAFGQLDVSWTHDLVVTRAVASDNGRGTSYTVEYILMVGLTLPTSTLTTNGLDWDSQLESDFNWTQTVIQDYQARLPQAYTRRVVLVGQATPTATDHTVFFDQLASHGDRPHRLL